MNLVTKSSWTPPIRTRSQRPTFAVPDQGARLNTSLGVQILEMIGATETSSLFKIE